MGCFAFVIFGLFAGVALRFFQRALRILIRLEFHGVLPLTDSIGGAI